MSGMLRIFEDHETAMIDCTVLIPLFMDSRDQ